MQYVWIHGWAANHHVFDSISHKLDKHKERHLLLDLPGHTDEPYDASMYDHYNEFNVSQELLKKIYKFSSGQPVNLIGWSFGGYLSLIMCLIQPQLFSSLILFNSMSRFSKSDDYLIGKDPKNLLSLCESFKHDFHKNMEQFWQLQLMYANTSNFDYKEIAKTQCQYGIPPALYESSQTVIQSDVRSRLSELKLPILIFSGAKDRITTSAMNKYIQKNTRNSYFYELQRSAHAPFISEEDACLTLMQNFYVNQFKIGVFT